jgi:hypothetical protein
LKPTADRDPPATLVYRVEPDQRLGVVLQAAHALVAEATTIVPRTTWNPVGKLNVAVTPAARMVLVDESNSRKLMVPVAWPYWVELVNR